MSSEIVIYGLVGLVAVALFVGARMAAAKFGRANTDAARQAFDDLPDFSVGAMLIYLGSAISFDPSRKAVAIWKKATGARRLAPQEVGAWHSGQLLTVIATRTTSTPMVQLYSGPDDDKPFFKVGVLNERDCKAWTARLNEAFGADKNREIAVRIIGP